MVMIVPQAVAVYNRPIAAADGSVIFAKRFAIPVNLEYDLLFISAGRHVENAPLY